MTASSSATDRPRVVGVIASRADLGRALGMRKPPDLFELRLDHLAGTVEQHRKSSRARDLWSELKNTLPRLRAPLIITARHPQEGGANPATVGSLRFVDSIFAARALCRCRTALGVCFTFIAHTGKTEKSPADHFIPQFQIDAASADFGGKSARGQGAWRRYLQGGDAHRHTDSTRAPDRFHHKQGSQSFRCRNGNRQTRRNFARAARACWLGSGLCIRRRRDRHRRAILTRTTSLAWNRFATLNR